MENRSNNILVGSVVLILLLVAVVVTVWLASFGGTHEKKYDILFKTSVDGLAKGSTVAFSGVPVGKIDDISLVPDQPELIRVRIEVKEDTPILEGTAATVQGSFTGTSTINLDGAVKGAPPIDQPGPWGFPLIPPKAGGLGAILANAPQLLDRLTTLTERITDLLNPQNQKSISDTLAHIDTLSGALADRSQDIAATLADAHLAVQQAGDAAQKIGNLADTTNQNVKPLLANLNDAVASAKHSMANLDGAIADARPGIKAISTQTVPNLNKLIADLGETASSLQAISGKLDRGGAGGLIGGDKLPDYKGHK
ncbi:phospholipid/cholesterol/gamma-HCH transport system substrate-binding protein [Sphingomonas vulcanisoli]|uniref:Phospholipid/cholesterol/gamma-HCH transport system substrate-binding protein n=1 Tax=Sphingomonas vulcanisoli TaxID=1658060 RepID=A0ABX0TST3_9SPHN|nr:MlaD family protein [Sphingomonas vulcanisoli]NIJ07452.1 phospholipid/cholesterol/gamma-HCH transport system substrate-binding protein [Sphingomonas vulcanisoli]